MSVEQLNAVIDNAMRDSEHDRVISAKDLKAEIKNGNSKYF